VRSREKTIAEDRRIAKRLLEAFGDVPLSEMTASRISACKAVRLASKHPGTGEPLTASAVNRPLGFLRAVLGMAHSEWEVLPAVPKVKLETEPEGRIRWLEADEEPRLLEACRRSNLSHLEGFTVCAMETGMRLGELMGLTWDRVDFSRAVVRLEVTKSGRRREVPMRTRVYEVLSGLAAQPRQADGYVWPRTSTRKAFRRAVRAARIEDFHFHDTRHHFASWFMMRGGTLLTLSKILGHAAIAMTMRYAHLSPEHLRGEMERTDAASRAEIGQMNPAPRHEVPENTAK